jgi:hypothetical protein
MVQDKLVVQVVQVLHHQLQAQQLLMQVAAVAVQEMWREM